MARRHFGRAVGATSLEIKCLFLFGVFLLVVMAFSLWLYWRVTEEVVYEQNPLTAGLLVDQALLYVHWEKLETNEDFKQTTLKKMSKNMAETLNEKGVEATFLYRPDSPSYPASGPGRPANEFERELMARFMLPGREDDGAEGGRSDWDDTFSPDGEDYYYYQAIRANRSCTEMCHVGLPPRNVYASPVLSIAGIPEVPAEGELLAIAKITIPNKPTREAVNRYWGFLLGVAIITAFLAMIALYIVIRYVIIRPLRHLRGVSDSIARGDINMRADIRTGDEFEALALAFNRMLRHLVDAQEELREANVNLDVKVDELAKLNMRLYEMNRVKSDFMATMSHELRTPLNGILGFSDVLGSIDSLDAKQKRYVENIQKSGRMLLEMVNNVLDLAKVESGKMELRLSSFDIGKVLSAQCDMARPLSEKKNIDLVEQIAPELPAMYQDQSRVQQILNNLLSNAIKFTPEGGRIKVTAERDGRGELVLRVCDTGVGIAEEDQQVIFEKFRQGQTGMPGGDAMTREYGGSGLGLSIVRELSNLLGGEVSVESELGVGSTFTVRLPWEIEQKPLLDSRLTEDFEELGKTRFDRQRIRIDSSGPAAPIEMPTSQDSS